MRNEKEVLLQVVEALKKSKFKYEYHEDSIPPRIDLEIGTSSLKIPISISAVNPLTARITSTLFPKPQGEPEQVLAFYEYLLKSDSLGTHTAHLDDKEEYIIVHSPIQISLSENNEIRSRLLYALLDLKEFYTTTYAHLIEELTKRGLHFTTIEKPSTQ